MANQLIDLKITKIAFVDAGDNPEADIVVTKRKPDGDGGDNTPNETKEMNLIKKFLVGIAKAFGYSDEQAEQMFSGEVQKKTQTAAGGGDGSEGDTDLPDEDDDGEGGDGGGDNGGEVGKKKKKTEIGGYTEMAKIDKSKLTPEELAQLEAIEKKALVDDDDDNGGDNGGDGSDVNKNKDNGNEDGGDNGGADDGEDIYKGLHPEVAAEMKRLKKRADEAEERELMQVAKKYEIIGKKPEELCKTLKSLKDAGGTAYNDMLAVLDSAVEAVEKGGVFDEVGKRGGDGGVDEADKAWKQIENHAKEIRKAKPELTWDQALDEAAQQHPDLVHTYEENL